MRPHSLLFVGILAGCSGDRPNATAGAADYASATSDRCSTEGATRECSFVINETPLYKDCIVGKQTCGPNLRWGVCVRPDFVMTSAGEAKADTGESTFAGAPESDDSSCPVDAPALDAPAVELVAVTADRPRAEGGHIAPGTYVLTQAEVYTNAIVAGPTGTTVQRTVVVTNDHFAFTEHLGDAAKGIDETTTNVFWFGTNGIAFGYEPTCPRTKHVVSIEYSAHGNELVLFANSQKRDVLTRKP
jgi:hypothetical protein